MKRIVETENYAVREAVFDDYKQFLEWERDSEMTRFFSIDEGRTYEDVVTEGFNFRNDKTVMDLTIVEKKSDRLLGRVIISRIEEHYRSLDITKIYVGGSNRGKGIGSEVMKGLLKYFFEEMDFERITLDYYTGNTRAASLYRSLGFVDEGCARNACTKDGKFYDLNIMSILSAEYRNKY